MTFDNQSLAPVLESMTDGVIVADLAGKLVYFNTSAKRILRQEPMGSQSAEWQTQFGVFYPDRVTPMDERQLPLVRALTGELVVAELQFLRSPATPDGVFLEVNAQPLRGDNGSITGGVAVIRDVTERYTAEKRFRDLIEAAPDAMVIVDGNGTIVQVNPQCERLFGWTRDELVGQAVERLIQTDAVAGHVALRDGYLASPDSRVMAAGRPLTGLHRDGSDVPVEIKLTPLPYADGVLVAAWVHDVSDRQRREQTLSALRDLARAANRRLDLDSILRVTLSDVARVMHCPVAAMLWLENGRGHNFRVAAVNGSGAKAAERAGLTPDARIAASDTGLASMIGSESPYWIDDLTLATTPAEQAMAASGLRSYCAAPLITESKMLGVLLLASNRESRTGESDAHMLAALNESLALAIRNATLFAELDTAYGHLRAAHEVARDQERLRAMGQMASGIAHDLNNALSPVVTLSEVLAEGHAPPDRVQRYLKAIRSSALDSQKIIGRLREFYRAPSEGDSMAPVDINQLLDSVQDMAAPRWQSQSEQEGRGISLVLDFAPDLPPVLGQETELRQAVLNLIINAADAMRDGGELRLSTALVDQPGGQAVEIRVSDTGVGMDDEIARQIFEPYFTTKRERGGTGLGMSIVWGVIRRHQGRIEVETAPDKGTTMVIRLPVQATDATASGRVERVSTIRTAGLTALCVDDDPRLRDLVTRSRRMSNG